MVGDVCYEEFVVNFEFDGVLEGLVVFVEYFVEIFGLGDGVGEIVKDEVVVCYMLGFVLGIILLCLRYKNIFVFVFFVVVEFFFDYVNDNFVRDEIVGIYDFFSCLVEGGFFGNLGLEYVIGGLLLDDVVVSELDLGW